MTTCGDDLCNGLKYVMEQRDPEVGAGGETPASPAVSSSSFGNNNEKQETAPVVVSSASSSAAPDYTTNNKNMYASSSSSPVVSSKNNEIRATVLMISGCQDSQTSADVSNVASFSLPDPNGQAGGACTSALLKVLYEDHRAVTDLTFAQVIQSMRSILARQKFTQVPQLSSSAAEFNVNQDFYLVPPNCNGGTKRAVLIGINYFGQSGELTGCINDCMNMKDYIQNVWGFASENIVVLTDNNPQAMPTKANILAAYQTLVRQSASGDAIFCHYSGHGARVRDDDRAEEDDGYDETLVPVDYNSAGQIRDDDIYQNLVCGLNPGVHLVALMDCCHSGSVLDLPFKYQGGGGSAGGGGNMFGSAGASSMVTSVGKMGPLMCCCCCLILVILAIVLPLTLL